MTMPTDLEYHFNEDMEMCKFCKGFTVMCEYCGWCWCTRSFVSKHMENNGRCRRCYDLFLKINVPIFDKNHVKV